MPSYLVGSVKDLALAPGAMKEVVVDTKPASTKILLYRLGDEFRATSPLCPHYKAPLSKGVLTPDGRVMCPWHGACFDVGTGDIEDPPAFSPLHSYAVTLKGEYVYVDLPADTESLKTPRVAAPCAKRSPKAETLVVVGSGPGGFYAAEAARLAGHNGPILLLSSETTLPIDRPKLSKSLLLPAVPELVSEERLAELDITFMPGHTVTSIDHEGRRLLVTADSAKKAQSYDSLILAPGLSARTLSISGHDLSGIHTLRTHNDFQEILASLDAAGSAEAKQPLVVLGSSFIGMEMAAAAAKKFDVTVVGMEKVPFERVLGAEVGGALHAFAESKGINFIMEDTAVAYEGSPAGRVSGVRLKSGRALPAAVVVLGVGMVASLGWVPEGWLAPGGSGIRVNSHMNVVSDEGIVLTNVWAVGDAAVGPSPYYDGNRRTEHWNVAASQGKVAGKNAVRRHTAKAPESWATVPYFWTGLFGKSIRYAGSGFGWDEVVVQGSLSELAWVAVYGRAGKVIAVASMGKDPVVSHASELLRLGLMPDLAEVRAGLDLMDVSLGHVAGSTSLASARSDTLVYVVSLVVLLLTVGWVALQGWR